MRSDMLAIFSLVGTNVSTSSYFHRNNPVDQLLQIAPTSNTCEDASFPEECAVSDRSTAYAILSSFSKYDVKTAPEQAALLSYMAFESGDFKYNRNHYPEPGRPGQGTRCMMMPDFVSEYAESISKLDSEVKAAGDDVDAVLELVQPDKYSFACAAWYYNKHCSAEIKKGVQHDGEAGWEAFLIDCVETELGEDEPNGRRDYWRRAVDALNVAL